MSTLTTGDLKLVKPAVIDDIDQTIGTDLPNNFQSIDIEITARVKKETGKALSTNDYTTAEKLKLSKIAAEATKVADSTTNGNILVNGQEVNVYDDKDINTRVDAIITSPVEGVSAQEIIDARQGEASLGAKITKVGEQINSLDAEFSSQLAEIATCSSLGLIPNDATSAQANYTKLTTAFNTGRNILVDGKYYLDVVSSQPIKTLKMSAHTVDAEFVFSASLWTLDNNSDIDTISIDGIKWTSENDEGARIISCADKIFYINTLSITNNVFSGSVGIFRMSLGINLYPDPALTKIGFGTILIKGNTIKNTKLGSFLLNDMPHELVILKDNNVQNFEEHIFYMGINNENPHGVEIKKRMKRLISSNNTVVCEDSWWSVKNQLYYLFILYEGLHCEYKNNHIEGLKSEQLNTVVYDSYLSCNVVNYMSNFCKNNMSFREQKTNTCGLMKSKSGTSGLAERFYENNDFIVTKEWVERLGKPLHLAYNTIFIGDDEFDKVIIKNNYIDVVWLIGGVSTFANTLEVSNNRIKSIYMEGRITEFLALKNTYNFTNVNIKVIGNDISDEVLLTSANARPETSGHVIETCLFTVRGSGGNIDAMTHIPNITISKNTVRCSLLTRIIGSMYLDSDFLTLDNVYFHDNRISRTKGAVLLLVTGMLPLTGAEKSLYIDNFYNSNNEINVESVDASFYGMGHFPIQPPNYQYKLIYNKKSNWTRSFLAFPWNKNVDRPYTVYINVNILGSHGIENLSTSINVSYDVVSDRNKITFPKLSDSGATNLSALLVKKGDTTYSDLHNESIYVAGGSNHTLQLMNTNGNPACLVFSFLDSFAVRGEIEVRVQSVFNA